MDIYRNHVIIIVSKRYFFPIIIEKDIFEKLSRLKSLRIHSITTLIMSNLFNGIFDIISLITQQ